MNDGYFAIRSKSGEKQMSYTPVKERHGFVLGRGIPTQDAMTVHVWVHFPLDSDRTFRHNLKVPRGNQLRSRKHRWTTVFYGQTPDETEINHLSVLDFEDGFGHCAQAWPAGPNAPPPEGGAQFGVVQEVTPGSQNCSFWAFVDASAQQQRRIDQLDYGWHMLTLVTAAPTSAPLSQLYVDGEFWGEAAAQGTCPITAIGGVPSSKADIPQNVTAISTVTVERGSSSSASVRATFDAARRPRVMLRSAERMFPPLDSTSGNSAPAAAGTSGAAGPSSPPKGYVPRPEPSTSRRPGARPKAAAGPSSGSGSAKRNFFLDGSGSSEEEEDADAKPGPSAATGKARASSSSSTARPAKARKPSRGKFKVPEPSAMPPGSAVEVELADQPRDFNLYEATVTEHVLGRQGELKSVKLMYKNLHQTTADDSPLLVEEIDSRFVRPKPPPTPSGFHASLSVGCTPDFYEAESGGWEIATIRKVFPPQHGGDEPRYEVQFHSSVDDGGAGWRLGPADGEKQVVAASKLRPRWDRVGTSWKDLTHKHKHKRTRGKEKAASEEEEEEEEEEVEEVVELEEGEEGEDEPVAKRARTVGPGAPVQPQQPQLQRQPEPPPQLQLLQPQPQPQPLPQQPPPQPPPQPPQQADAADWTVAEVVAFVRDVVGLREDAASAFEVNLVNGELLKTLTDEDLKTELSLLPLQIRRFRLELGKLAA